MRLAGKYNDRGEGHVTNVLNGSEIGGEKETGFRAKMLWQPSDRLSLVFKYEQLELESNDEGSLRSQLSRVFLLRRRLARRRGPEVL